MRQMCANGECKTISCYIFLKSFRATEAKTIPQFLKGAKIHKKLQKRKQAMRKGLAPPFIT